jgi:hypothetical protein
MNALSAALAAPLLVAAPLLDPVPAAGDVKPGWLALGLVVGLFVVTTLLWFSMKKQLRRIDFEEPADEDESAPERHENGAGPA